PRTGKTAAYCIALVQRAIKEIKHPQIIILQPTALSPQRTVNLINHLGNEMGIHASLATSTNPLGGSTADAIICGTPDCLLESIDSNLVATSHVRNLILDSADQLVTHGFIDKVYDIHGRLNACTLQVVVLSSTLSPPVGQFVNDFTTTYVSICPTP
ncbi:hypothetical protein PFISCL1PPCAC_9695, partial [Pristionchus fissidentatus]